jgi:hypothetical protein
MEPASAATQEKKPKSLLDRASNLLETDPQQVLALLASFADLHPDHAQMAGTYFLRGCALDALGESNDALKAFDRISTRTAVNIRLTASESCARHANLCSTGGRPVTIRVYL